MPLDCLPTTYLVNRGADTVAGTVDDKFASPRLCAGAGCTQNDDCRVGGGTAVCAAELSPANPLGAVSLRCRPPTSAALRGGAACTDHLECESGLCGTLQLPSTGTGRACFEACTAATLCDATTSCRVAGLRVPMAQGSVSLDSCAP